MKYLKVNEAESNRYTYINLDKIHELRQPIETLPVMKERECFLTRNSGEVWIATFVNGEPYFGPYDEPEYWMPLPDTLREYSKI